MKPRKRKGREEGIELVKPFFEFQDSRKSVKEKNPIKTCAVLTVRCCGEAPQLVWKVNNGC